MGAAAFSTPRSRALASPTLSPGRSGVRYAKSSIFFKIPLSNLAVSSNLNPHQAGLTISPDLTSSTFPLHLEMYESSGSFRWGMSEASSTSTTWKSPPGFTTCTHFHTWTSRWGGERDRAECSVRSNVDLCSLFFRGFCRLKQTRPRCGKQ